MPMRYKVLAQIPADSVSDDDGSFDPEDRSQELRLLDDDSVAKSSSERHGIQTAPLLTMGAYDALAKAERPAQYGVLGTVLSAHHKDTVSVPPEGRLYYNTNSPSSAIICGVQGSGKSHTAASLLETMVIAKHRPLGVLHTPHSCLVLHLGEGGPAARPSEAVYVGLSNSSDEKIRTPRVRVFVSRSFLGTMKRVYSNISENVTVEPLLLQESELDAEAFLSMMAVGSSETAPLYMQIVLSILRDLGENFTYTAFKKRLQAQRSSLNPAQVSGLDQRMSLLSPFLLEGKPEKKDFLFRGQQRFAPGQITIVDLSDPFIDASSACALFNIVTRLFVRADVGRGKVLLVDEAHKYLNTAKSFTGLSNTLITINREQRHLGMTLLVSTQEPTVIPPELLDLCPMLVLHRFSSPSWWEHLKKHSSSDLASEKAFDTVVNLKTGEAIVLSPTGLGVFGNDEKPVKFGRRFMIVKIRKRVTRDGGASILAVENN